MSRPAKPKFQFKKLSKIELVKKVRGRGPSLPQNQIIKNKKKEKLDKINLEEIDSDSNEN